MKSKTFLAVALAAVTALASCQKEKPENSSIERNLEAPIRFSVGESSVSVTGLTRSVSESTLSSLQKGGMYVTATRGIRGTDESVYMECVRHDVVDNASTSSYFWPSEGTGRLSFYALNVQKTPVFKKGGTAVTVPVAPVDGDVIAAFSDSLATSHGEPVTLDFRHVLARLYDIKLSTSDAAARAFVNSITVTPAWDAGNYDFTAAKVTGATAGTAQSISVPASLEFNSTPGSVGQSVVDRLVVEGNVTIKITYTLKRNGYEATMTGTGSVNLTAGKKTTINGVLSDDARGISLAVTVQPWTEAEIPADLS